MQTKKSLASGYIKIALFIFPLIFFLFGEITRYKRGPYDRKNGDPEYAYHAASMNVATGIAPLYVDHPGVPVHMLGGLIYRLKHLLSFDVQDSFEVDAIKRTSEYTISLGRGIILICSITLIGIGFLIYRLSSSWFLAIFGQSSILFSFFVFRSLSRARAEPMLIFHGLLVCFLVLAYLAYREKYPRLKYLVGASVGFGIATKLNFVPIGFLPLFLFRKPREFLLYPVSCFVGFLVGTCAIVTEYPRFIIWVSRLSRNSGTHGLGKTDFFVTVSETLSRFFGQVGDFFTFKSHSLSNMTLAICIFLVLLNILKSKTKISKWNEEVWLSLGVALTTAMTLLATAKHPGGFYGLPLYTLMPLVVYLCAKNFKSLISSYQKQQNQFLLGGKLASVIGLVFFISYFSSTYQKIFDNRARNELLAVQKMVDNEYRSCALAGFFGVSSPYAALDIFYRNGGHHYRESLDLALPRFNDTFIYSVFGNKFYKIADSKKVDLTGSWMSRLKRGRGKEHLVQRKAIKPISAIEDYFKSYPCVVLQGPSFTKKSMVSSKYQPPTNFMKDYKMTDLYNGQTQTLYLFEKKNAEIISGRRINQI